MRPCGISVSYAVGVMMGKHMDMMLHVKHFSTSKNSVEIPSGLGFLCDKFSMLVKHKKNMML